MAPKMLDRQVGANGHESEASALLGEAVHAEASENSWRPPASDDDDVPNVPVTNLRGIAIAVSLGFLIFLQGTSQYNRIPIEVFRDW